LFGGIRIEDVNVPFRLMRAACLRAMLERIPPPTFAPNVAIACLSARAGLRILNLPVEYHSRRTGSASLVRWRMWKAAARSFFETGQILIRNRGFRCGS
jgi:hypothetical protein